MEYIFLKQCFANYMKHKQQLNNKQTNAFFYLKLNFHLINNLPKQDELKYLSH